MNKQPTDRQATARAIRAYIARARISRDEFAHRTRLGKSTVDKLLTGLFSDKTLLQVETALDQTFRPRSEDPSVAPEAYGGYSREDAQKYIGRYVFARPSFVGEAAIYAFAMEIVWDDAIPALLVRETASGEMPAQLGHVFMPRASMHVFIQSNEHGWLKQLILSRIDVTKCMKGVMLTMGEVFANVFMPVALPVLLSQRDRISDDMVGKLTPASAHYAGCLADLLSVEKQQYARWITLPEASAPGVAQLSKI